MLRSILGIIYIVYVSRVTHVTTEKAVNSKNTTLTSAFMLSICSNLQKLKVSS